MTKASTTLCATLAAAMAVTACAKKEPAESTPPVIYDRTAPAAPARTTVPPKPACIMMEVPTHRFTPVENPRGCKIAPLNDPNREDIISLGPKDTCDAEGLKKYGYNNLTRNVCQ